VAAVQGHETVVWLLLDKGADVNASAKDDGKTPFFRAVSKGHDAVARLLLERGANPEARDRVGQTPLHEAAKNGHAGIIALLLAHDVYAWGKDNRGLTPLDLARRSGKASAVQALEEALAGRKPLAPPPVAAASAPPTPRSAVDVPPSLSPKPKPGTHALVVGIERYRNALPPADFASRDAETMERYLVQAMGIPAHQVV
jgi:ankyrin repeat protein